LAVTVTVPEGAAVKSRFAVQAPAEHVTVAEASPEITTFFPFSEHVPETVKLGQVEEFMYVAAAGEVIATDGATVSFENAREA
jgi:hypothetical protein